METEKAKKIWKAIQEKHKKEDMDEGAYKILKKKYKDILETPSSEERIEEPSEETREKGEPSIKSPEKGGPKDLETLATDLMIGINDLKEEITVLKSEKKSTERLLSDLKKKLEKGSIREERFEELSKEHKTKIKDLDSQIENYKEQIAQAKKRLKEISSDIEKKVKKYKEILAKIDKF